MTISSNIGSMKLGIKQEVRKKTSLMVEMEATIQRSTIVLVEETHNENEDIWWDQHNDELSCIIVEVEVA
jgi:hypothetical protein